MVSSRPGLHQGAEPWIDNVPAFPLMKQIQFSASVGFITNNLLRQKHNNNLQELIGSRRYSIFLTPLRIQWTNHDLYSGLLTETGIDQLNLLPGFYFALHPQPLFSAAGIRSQNSDFTFCHQKIWHRNRQIELKKETVKYALALKQVLLKNKTQALKMILFWYFLRVLMFSNDNLLVFSLCFSFSSGNIRKISK